jgi:hypothetical protein
MLGLITGALLGLRFRAFFVLCPVVTVAAAIFLFDVALGGAVTHGLLAALVAAVALQFGFLAGVLIDGLLIRGRPSGRDALAHQSIAKGKTTSSA